MFMEIKIMTKFKIISKIKMKTAQQAYRENSPDGNWGGPKFCHPNICLWGFKVVIKKQKTQMKL